MKKKAKKYLNYTKHLDYVWKNKIKTISILIYTAIVTAICGVILKIIFNSLEYIFAIAFIGIFVYLAVLVVEHIIKEAG